MQQRQEKETTVNTTQTPATPGAGAMPAPGTTTTRTVVNERERVQGPVTWEEMRAMMRREPEVVERTWRPTVGGLLSIFAGSWNLILGIGAVFGGTILNNLLPTINGVTLTGTTGITAGIILIIFGIVSIVGGAYALSRRGWPIALAGSILALIPNPLVLPFIMGFFSLIFNVLGHREFWAKSRGEIV